MYSSLVITDLLYDVLNDVSLTGEITGGLYKEASGLNDELENVIIMTAPISSKYLTGVQKCLSNVNIHIPANSNGTSKLSRFKELTEIVRNLLDNNRHPGKGFYFDVIFEGLFNELLQNKTYYYNFKINIQKQ